MATKNPRIAFVPSDRLRAVVLRLSKAAGTSMAGVCSELLEESVPVIEELIVTLDAVASNDARARELLKEYGSAMKVAIDEAMGRVDAPELPLPVVDLRKKHHGRAAGGRGA